MLRCLVFSKFIEWKLSGGQVPIIGALNERVRKKERGRGGVVEGTITNLPNHPGMLGVHIPHTHTAYLTNTGTVSATARCRIRETGGKK